MTLDDFRTAQARELQKLGSSPTPAEIDAAIARLEALGPPPEATWEAFITLREWVSSP